MGLCWGFFSDFPLRCAEPSALTPVGFALHVRPRPSQAFTQTCQAWLGAGGRHLSPPTRSESSTLIFPNHRALKSNTNPGGHWKGGGPWSGEGHVPIRPGGGGRGFECLDWGSGNPCSRPLGIMSGHPSRPCRPLVISPWPPGGCPTGTSPPPGCGREGAGTIYARAPPSPAGSAPGGCRAWGQREAFMLLFLPRSRPGRWKWEGNTSARGQGPGGHLTAGNLLAPPSPSEPEPPGS